ncbi:DedA family protein [Streptomyces niveus]|uniref:DedA family protein n=1 Tax=Streptomyces niveus TaxID=193462 RepID=UPI0036EE8BF2
MILAVEWSVVARGEAAILGDQAGHLFGARPAPLSSGPDSRLFKRENVEKANAFFDKYGPRSIVLARLVPVVRTFTPIVAGVSAMHYRTFVLFIVIGGTLWGVGVTVLGYFLGQIDFVKAHIEFILSAIVPQPRRSNSELGKHPDTRPCL